FANVISQGLLMFLYIFFVIIVMIPGVVATFILALAPWGGIALGLAALTVWELLMSALFFFLSRGVLDTCDIETAQKPTK
ncbi:hypothetical protein LJC60_10410, partial [Ruminococcaceae bacterium OttesenSCG-928-D13]|nr:hypothetical protein [Ruminococcaceae bacterium OttesenSCG-928-D13]